MSMGYEETPPGDRVRELIRKCEREREGNADKIERALRDSHAARVMANGMSWKLNFILTGVGATFAMLLGLVAWTVARVDGIEAKSISAARDEASRVAWRLTSGVDSQRR